MQLVQIYGDPGVPLEVATDGTQLAATVSTHKHRLVEAFARLTEEQWATETRCDGWDARNLADHLADATEFFDYTLSRALEGEATRLLEGFDPRETPKQAAESRCDQSASEALAKLELAESRLQETLSAYEADERGQEVWNLMAEAPPGNCAARVSLQHCLFDSWLHERDLLLPLGITPVENGHEILATAAYLCALAGIASLATLDPHPAPGEVLRVGIPDQNATIEITVGLPTVVRIDHSETAVDVEAPGILLAEAMSGRSDLASIADPGTRPYAILSGALPFLSS